MFKKREGQPPGTTPESISDGTSPTIFETYVSFLQSEAANKLGVLERALNRKPPEITLEQFLVLNRQLDAQKETKIKKLEDDLARAHIDGLTSLLRRDVLEPRLDKLVGEMDFPEEHRNIPVQAVMVIKIDINDFKVFNEKPYDHDFGDKVLQTFADRLRSSTKEGSDLLFRYGGDEFAIIMPFFDKGVDFAQLFADKQKLINENLFVTAPNGDVLPVTCSMGYSVAEKSQSPKKTREILLQEAEAMERIQKIENGLEK